ncbi:Fasciclin-like arabinogalactan protein [Thalictrum thalictroides]|uniref:Fasciclin-like arabinogalactan protein n=1 Tax=Thalictrum thalictroides TaxID=46969 RepID=A0A7J6X7V5_THATH|nr:Fasciclin-like arabinogalactan protein [Thalictrum thalictroides]
MFHIIPKRIGSNEWPQEISDESNNRHLTLARDTLHFTNTKHSGKKVGLAKIIHLDVVIRPDGVIHGIERLLVPRSVQEDFNRRRSLRSISAVLPQGAPDPRTNRLKKPASPSPAGCPSRSGSPCCTRWDQITQALG